MFIADLHIHSHYARATSKQCEPSMLAYWAARKGLDLIGTGDFTHPGWREELRRLLTPAGNGFYTLRPLMVEWGINSQGFGILTSSIVLAIMIIPYASSLSGEFIAMVPNELKEAAYSLGATRYDVIRTVTFPAAGSGIFASYILALGRALGETMAVTMLIGNTNNVPLSLGDTGNTMASIIANQFGEADGIKLSSLIAIGLLLFLITAIINMIAKLIIKKLH